MKKYLNPQCKELSEHLSMLKEKGIRTTMYNEMERPKHATRFWISYDISAEADGECRKNLYTWLSGLNAESFGNSIASFLIKGMCINNNTKAAKWLINQLIDANVLIEDKDITAFTQGQLAKMRNENIGFMFQFHYLLADFTVMENILMPVWDKRKEKKEYALNMLKIMGLTDRANHMPNELSGGEQQRVALARALINNPKILFADEPTGNLDRQTGKLIENLMFDMCSRLKTTLLVVTHSQELANLADRQIKIVDGKIC